MALAYDPVFASTITYPETRMPPKHCSIIRRPPNLDIQRVHIQRVKCIGLEKELRRILMKRSHTIRKLMH